jgi:hypothetical protein
MPRTSKVVGLARRPSRRFVRAIGVLGGCYSEAGTDRGAIELQPAEEREEG